MSIVHTNPALYADFIWKNCSARSVYRFYDGKPTGKPLDKQYTITATYVGSLCIVANKVGGGSLFTFDIPDPFFKADEAVGSKERFVAAFSKYLSPIGDQLWVEEEPAETGRPILRKPEEVSVNDFAEGLIRMTYSDKRRMVCFTKEAAAEEQFCVVFREIGGTLCIFCNSLRGGNLFAYELSDAENFRAFKGPFLEYLANQGFGDSVWIKQ